MQMSAVDVEDSASHGFTTRQVSELLGVPQRRLRYWSQTGFIPPSGGTSGRAAYSFRDLIAIKVAHGLLEQGLPLRRVRSSLSALASSLPHGDGALARVRVRCEGDRVVVADAGRSFEPVSGQLVLDFDVEALRQDAATVLELPWVGSGSDDDLDTAYEWFLRGCELEEEWGGAPADIDGFEAARGAYERALELDAELAAAWTNLGSMFALRGELEDAQQYFERALEVDGEQPEARCNLAELRLRSGDTHGAVMMYREVLQLVPDWWEAHYGLARALLGLGGRAQALAHLERFCAAVDAAIPVDEELAERRARTQVVMERLRAELGSD